MDKEERIRYGQATVEALPVPQSAKDILLHQGLPREHEFFTPAESLTQITQGYCCVGHDFATDICVDTDGRVLSISKYPELPDRYVNSDLDAFVRFLDVVKTERRRLATLPESKVGTAVEALAQTLRMIDLTAFANPENWWSVIVEQMEDGLL